MNCTASEGLPEVPISRIAIIRKAQFCSHQGHSGASDGVKIDPSAPGTHLVQHSCQHVISTGRCEACMQRLHLVALVFQQ